MIISRTPFRISLFGGGTDYPQWYRRNGGAVLGFAINKYCYISLRPLPPFFEHRHRIVYSKIETVNELADIQHPAVRAVLQDAGIGFGIEIHHDGDLPARSGLGSSSSFTVGMIAAVRAHMGRMIGSRDLAREAIRIEQDVIREHVGCQDQIWAAYGGLNRIDFPKVGDFAVQPLIVSPERQAELIGSLLLVFTGVSRYAPEIARAQIANIDARERHLRTMLGLVDQAQAVLQDAGRPLRDIGALLHESWMLKRELADGVTTPLVDEIYQAARDAGAIGGKLLGAGGGGFMLFYVEPARRARVEERLKDLIRVKFDVDSVGSRIVVYEPAGLGAV